jgi:hypothetical protein
MFYTDSDLHFSANTGFVIWNTEVYDISINGYIAFMLQIRVYIEKRLGTVPRGISGVGPSISAVRNCL